MLDSFYMAFHGAFQDQGREEYQEDRLVHQALSEDVMNMYRTLEGSAKTKFFSDFFKTINRMLKKEILLGKIPDCGSAGIVALVDHTQKKIDVINLGDCEAIVVRANEMGEILEARRLNELHNFGNENEHTRVTDIEPSLLAQKYPRFNGRLNLTRAFGNIWCKTPAFTDDAQGGTYDCQQDEDEKIYLILASDGLREGHFTLKNVADNISLFINEGFKKSLTELAQSMIKESLNLGSYDNISVQIVEVSKQNPKTGVEFLAVFDGHSGVFAAQFLAKNVCSEFEKFLRSKLEYHSGAPVLSAYQHKVHVVKVPEEDIGRTAYDERQELARKSPTL